MAPIRLAAWGGENEAIASARGGITRLLRELPVSAISRIMEKSPAAVASLLYRGLKALRDRLADERPRREPRS